MSNPTDKERLIVDLRSEVLFDYDQDSLTDDASTPRAHGPPPPYSERGEFHSQDIFSDIGHNVLEHWVDTMAQNPKLGIEIMHRRMQSYYDDFFRGDTELEASDTGEGLRDCIQSLAEQIRENNLRCSLSELSIVNQRGFITNQAVHMNIFPQASIPQNAHSAYDHSWRPDPDMDIYVDCFSESCLLVDEVDDSSVSDNGRLSEKNWQRDEDVLVDEATRRNPRVPNLVLTDYDADDSSSYRQVQYWNPSSSINHSEHDYSTDDVSEIDSFPELVRCPDRRGVCELCEDSHSVDQQSHDVALSVPSIVGINPISNTSLPENIIHQPVYEEDHEAIGLISQYVGIPTQVMPRWASAIHVAPGYEAFIDGTRSNSPDWDEDEYQIVSSLVSTRPLGQQDEEESRSTRLRNICPSQSGDPDHTVPLSPVPDIFKSLASTYQEVESIDYSQLDADSSISQK